jgi:hypothetical protein
MPKELRQAYLEYKHEKLRTDLACKGEFYRLFQEMNYTIIEMEDDDIEIPKYERLNIKKDLEQIGDDPQLKTEKEVFSKWVDFDEENPSEAANELFKKRKSKYKYIKRASVEKNSAHTEQALYIFNKRDKKATWYELSKEEKLRYQVVSKLNQLLQLPHSFAGREEPLPRDELTGPILSYLSGEKEKVLIEGLFKVKIGEDLSTNPEKVQTIINKIYKDWTGIGRKLKAGEKERVRQNGKQIQISPYVIQEVLISDTPFWDLIKDRGEHKQEEDNPELEELCSQLEEHKKEKSSED